ERGGDFERARPHLTVAVDRPQAGLGIGPQRAGVVGGGHGFSSPLGSNSETAGLRIASASLTRRAANAMDRRKFPNPEGFRPEKGRNASRGGTLNDRRGGAIGAGRSNRRAAMTASTNWRDEVVSLIPALRAFAWSLSHNGSDADDLVQDTLIKAWTNREKFEP